NDDVTIPRNRVRGELMPVLVDRFNPGIVDVLANEAELARETWAWLESVAGEFEKGVRPLFVGTGEKGSYPIFELDVERLKAAPGSLRRLVLWRAMNRVEGGRPVSFEHVEAALQLLEADRGAVDAPGHRVQRLGTRLVLTGRHKAGTNLFQYPLSIPGEVRLAEAGCIVAAELGPG